MTADTEVLALRLWLGVAHEGDINDWLDAYVAQVSEPHPDVLELFSLVSGQLRSAFLAFVRTEHGFDPSADHGSRVATRMLAQLCQSALDGTLSVPDFCEAVHQLDSRYNEPGAGYPKGLLELWNGCDWCDEDWTIESEPHLRELLERRTTKKDDEPSNRDRSAPTSLDRDG